MGLHAAKTEEHPPEPRETVVRKQSRKRSPAADGVAIACAAGLLGMAVWFHGAAHLYGVLATTIIFALLAWLLRGVNASGSVAGAMLAFIVASRELRIFWMLLLVFLITLAATRAGASRKRRLKMAEAERGRSASQVMANLGIATLFLAIPSFPLAYVMVLAGLAELAADTTSSEIGTAFSGKTLLITNWKGVSPGTDGGISLTGTAAGMIAAFVTALCAFALGLASVSATLAIVCAGTGGMLVDSLLGATLEQRGYLNNNLVNLISTAAAVLFAWLLR